MDTPDSDIVLWIKDQRIALNHVIGIGLVNSQVRSILGRFADACIATAHRQVGGKLDSGGTGGGSAGVARSTRATGRQDR